MKIQSSVRLNHRRNVHVPHKNVNYYKFHVSKKKPIFVEAYWNLHFHGCALCRINAKINLCTSADASGGQCLDAGRVAEASFVHEL